MARPGAAKDAIEAWSVFEQFFVLSYRTAEGIPILITEISTRSAAILGVSRPTVSATTLSCSRDCCTPTTESGSSPSTGMPRPTASRS